MCRLATLPALFPGSRSAYPRGTPLLTPSRRDPCDLARSNSPCSSPFTVLVGANGSGTLTAGEFWGSVGDGWVAGTTAK